MNSLIIRWPIPFCLPFPPPFPQIIVCFYSSMFGISLFITTRKRVPHFFYTGWNGVPHFLSPIETSSGDLNSGSVHPSIPPTNLPSFCQQDKSSLTALIDSFFYRGVLHIKIMDKFNIDFCVIFFNFNWCL